MATDLLQYGVAVLPVADEDARRRWNAAFFDAMDMFPEYKVQGPTVQRVLGGFGAFGNPSSFHHPIVRCFRRSLKRFTATPMMQEYAQRRYGEEEAPTVRLESMIDRLCVRMKDFKSPTAESWHRDIYDGETYGLRPLPTSLPGNESDIILGGWSNLDHRPQVFVGLVGSHNEHFENGQGGFASFTEQDIATFQFESRLASQANQHFGETIHCNATGEIIVPPGHAIFFFQHLVHSVKSGIQPDTPALRLFHGFRLTTEQIPLMDIRSAIEHGGVPRIPSGQIPPMYSKNHYGAFSGRDPKWREWAVSTFHPQCLFARTTSKGISYYTPGSQGNVNRAANLGRYMPSLQEMDLFHASYIYTQEDVDTLHPELLFA